MEDPWKLIEDVDFHDAVLRLSMGKKKHAKNALGFRRGADAAPKVPSSLRCDEQDNTD